MDLATLTSKIISTTENSQSTFVSLIPSFIQDAERLISNTVQLPAARQTASISTVVSNPFVSVPTGFLYAYSLSLTKLNHGAKFLLNKDTNYIREAYPFSYDSTGYVGPQYDTGGYVNDTLVWTAEPVVYALFDATTLLLGPTPDAVYTLSLEYAAAPTSITGVSGRSWLGDNFENVLLWGALVEAYIYMKGEKELIDGYQAMFTQAMGPLKQLIDGKNRQDNYRVTQVRDQVQ